MLFHHAVVYQVEDYSVPSTVLNDLQSNYEVEVIEEPKLTIATVRRIIESAHKRPFASTVKVIYIATGSIAFEAQNALLKVLEEPPSSTKLVLWIGREVELLPTIKSRVQIITSESTATTSSVFKELMSTTVSERLTTIATVYKNKDTVADQQLYQGLTSALASSDTRLSPELRSQIADLHSKLNGPGASKKMLWEAIVLLWPVESNRT